MRIVFILLSYFSVNCALFLFWTFPWEGTERDPESAWFSLELQGSCAAALQVLRDGKCGLCLIYNTTQSSTHYTESFPSLDVI